MGEHIPKFKNEDEEVAFWDKTSVDSVAPDQLEEVEVERPARPLSATFAIRLDQNTVKLLREVAHEYSLGPTQLVRKWVMERIKIELEAGVLAPHQTGFSESLERLLRKDIVESAFQLIPKIAENAMKHVDEEAVNEAAARFDFGLESEQEETALP